MHEQLKHQEEMHNDHEVSTNELWKKSEQNSIIIALECGKKKFNELDEALKEKMKEAFIEEPCCLGCSDGRIHELRLGRAGMGIVAGVDATVEALKKTLNKEKAFVIKSHEGCGAAKIVCNKLIEEGKISADTIPDQLGIDFAKEIVEKLKAEGYNVSYSHMAATEMDETHDERAIYFDGTGKLNIENVTLENGEKLFPRGFVFSGLDFEESESVVELKALCGIAMGDHGFGSRLNKENPFYIIVSAKDEKQLADLKKTAEMAAWGFDGKVVVDGFVA